MDYKEYEKLGFPEQPCRYCLKRPTCNKRCIDYWNLAYDLKGHFIHLLADSTDSLLFRYLTLNRTIMPTRNLHSLPAIRSEIQAWMEGYFR